MTGCRSVPACASSISRCATSRPIGPTLANPSPLAASAGLEGDELGFGYSLRRDADAVRRHLDRYRFPLRGRTRSRRLVPVFRRSDQGQADAAGIDHRRHQPADRPSPSPSMAPPNGRTGAASASRASSNGRPARSWLSPYLPLDYEDGWFFSLGGEYRSTPPGSCAPVSATRSSPIDVDNRNPAPARLRPHLAVRSARPISGARSSRSTSPTPTSSRSADTDINIAPGNRIFPTRAVVLAADVDASASTSSRRRSSTAGTIRL